MFKKIKLIGATLAISFLSAGMASADLALDVSAAVMAELPTETPVITSPGSNTVSTAETVEITGSCPVIVPSLIVVVYRLDDVVGSAVCNSEGSFTILVGLVLGENIFIPKFLTVTGEYGGAGTALVINYNAPLQVDRGEPIPVSPIPVAPSKPATSTAGTGYIKIKLDKSLVIFKIDEEYDLIMGIDSNETGFEVIIDWGDGTRQVYKNIGVGLTSYKHTFTSDAGVSQPVRGWIHAPSGRSSLFSVAKANFKSQGQLPLVIANEPISATKRNVAVGAVLVPVTAFIGVSHHHFLMNAEHMNKSLRRKRK